MTAADALLTTHPLYPHVGPTAEEADAAEALRYLAADPAQAGYARDLAVLFVGRAQDRVWTHAQDCMRRLDEAERTERRTA